MACDIILIISSLISSCLLSTLQPVSTPWLSCLPNIWQKALAHGLCLVTFVEQFAKLRPESPEVLLDFFFFNEGRRAMWDLTDSITLSQLLPEWNFAS